MKVTLLTLISVVALIISGGLGCLPGKRLVFDLNATLEESQRLNNQSFDCPSPEADVPCFYFKHVFAPYFVIEDAVLGGSDRFLGSYTFKVVGGGPYSRKNIRYYSEEEILQFNSLRYSASSQKSLVWMLEDMTDSVQLTKEGFIVMGNTSNRVRWLCRRNSPCGDLTPSGLHDPDFFFVIEVSNKGINNNTNCEHSVQFELHVHGFPLNPFRALFFTMMTLTTILILLVCYVVYNCCGPSRETDDTDEDEEEQEDQSSVCDQLKADGVLMEVGWMMHSWILQLYRIIFSITQNAKFDYFLLLVVLVDVALLVAQGFQGVTERIGWFVSALEACFLAIYVMDIVLKILVLGYSFFKNPWDDLDFLVVLLSMVEFIMSLVGNTSDLSGIQSSTLFRVFKTFKGARALRAFRFLTMIRFFQTVKNVLRSFRSMGAIFALIFVFLLIFAIIFRGMFNVSDPAHFGSIFNTIFTLFQVLTLDDWSLIWTASRENGAPHIIFFLSAYIIVEYFTFLNLFIAVLVDNFQLTIKIQTPLESQQSTDGSEGKTESPKKMTEADMSKSEIVEEFYKEALRHAFSDSEHSKRKVELITRYLDLMAVMDQHQQKYRSLACLQDQLVEEFFKTIEE